MIYFDACRVSLLPHTFRQLNPAVEKSRQEEDDYREDDRHLSYDDYLFSDRLDVEITALAGQYFALHICIEKADVYDIRANRCKHEYYLDKQDAAICGTEQHGWVSNKSARVVDPCCNQNAHRRHRYLVEPPANLYHERNKLFKRLCV